MYKDTQPLLAEPTNASSSQHSQIYHLLAVQPNSKQSCLAAAREERDLEREEPSVTARSSVTTSRVSTRFCRAPDPVMPRKLR